MKQLNALEIAWKQKSLALMEFISQLKSARESITTQPETRKEYLAISTTYVQQLDDTLRSLDGLYEAASDFIEIIHQARAIVAETRGLLCNEEQLKLPLE